MIIQDKSKSFAIRVIRFYKYLNNEKNEPTLAKQILRCGTSIGANIAEASNAQSNKDFLAKLNIALKECSETKYWLEILSEAEIIGPETFEPLYKDCVEIEKLLTKSVKTTKNKL
ncbi:four helix bundle protein [Alistipes shahii]|jgi:four helix bundle protein|uniref:four helix bundle protein n=1 Tax=Alistipes shahii TaxID=328814 RepID=UPI00266D945D|nr:four helix bundle protein [Alistipes shahii]